MSLRDLNRLLITTSRSPRCSVVLASTAACSAIAVTYLGRELVVSWRGLWTEGELGKGVQEVDRTQALWFLAGSLVFVLILTLAFSLAGLVLGRGIWDRWTGLHRGLRSRRSNGPWPLLLVALSVVALSILMLQLRIGVTVPIASPEYPFRLGSLLYFVRLAIAPVVIAILAARSHLNPPWTFVIVLTVGGVASATSASRAVAVAYSLCVLAIAFRRRRLVIPAFATAIAVLVNVASRSRTLLIPNFWNDPDLQAIYVSDASKALALDASPAQSVGANLVDFAGVRALGLDELALALAYKYPEVGFGEAVAGLGQTLGIRSSPSPTCPELRDLFANGAERIGGLNLDPFGRLYAGSCGSSTTYLLALVPTSLLFSVVILGGVGLRIRWGMERAISLVLLLGILLWFDSRYTVLRFGLVALALSVFLDWKVVRPPGCNNHSGSAFVDRSRRITSETDGVD